MERFFLWMIIVRHQSYGMDLLEIYAGWEATHCHSSRVKSANMTAILGIR